MSRIVLEIFVEEDVAGVSTSLTRFRALYRMQRVRRIARITQHMPKTPRAIPATVGGANPATSEVAFDPDVSAELSEETDPDASDGKFSPGCSM